MKMNKEITDLVTFREANSNDVSFILATWLRGLKFGNSWYKLIDNTIYYSVYHKVIEAILIRPDTKILVACLKEDQEVILGYSVFEGARLHWVHIKKAWRKLGIAKELVPQEITSVSHLTETGKSIFLKKNSWIFNPFFLA